MNRMNRFYAGLLQGDQAGLWIKSGNAQTGIRYLFSSSSNPPPLAYIHCQKCTGALSKKNVKQEISEIEATDLGIPLISIDSGSNPTVSTRSSLWKEGPSINIIGRPLPATSLLSPQILSSLANWKLIQKPKNCFQKMTSEPICQTIHLS